MKFCTHCGKEIHENAVVCTACGCAVRQFVVKNNNVTTPQEGEKQGIVAVILGVIGIVTAWLLAIIGHIVSIIGIVIGIKEYKASGKITGLVLSIIGETCSIISSIIGIVTVMSYL